MMGFFPSSQYSKSSIVLPLATVDNIDRRYGGAILGSYWKIVTSVPRGNGRFIY